MLVRSLALFVAFYGIARSAAAQPQRFMFQAGEHVCFVGNTLGERMQHDGWLEAILHFRFPQQQLVVRNLCFSGDELTTRLRTADFGTPDEWLSRCRADVIFAFFGYNESFAGEAGLQAFEQDLRTYLTHLQGQKYNGESAPRIVLFSPIPHEDLTLPIVINGVVIDPGDPNMPRGIDSNQRLELYTNAMQRVANECGVVFVDLFHRGYEIIGRMTINGVHLNSTGNKVLAGDIDDFLFPVGPGPNPHRLQEIAAAVCEKNAIWFQRYRTTDGYSVYGGRSHLKFVDGQTNRDVAQREMEVLDVMTANRDRLVWAVAQGQQDYTVDDANVPPFLEVKTNKPGTGPNGTHLFLSGEDAIANMTVHSQMAVNLFAGEEQFPELVNPVQMAFDTRGRCWVAAWKTYPHWQPLVEEMDDKLLILEDDDGDGQADRCRTFAGGLHNPTGFEFWNGGVFVACCPDVWFLKDTDGDDVADVRLRVLHGLDSADTHHGSNSFTLDPGGALYFQEGTFHHTQVETAWGPPVRSANAACYRYEPRTQKFEVYVAYGFANPHGHVFDRWGQDFLTDGTGAVNYFAAAFSGRIDFPRKHARLDPFFQQRARPCPATEILSSRHFPDDMQDSYLIANVIGFQGIMNYRLIEKDSGFTAEEVEPIVFSTDPNFRPVDMEIAPDGSLYFTDWQNPIIGHMQHNLRDPSRDKTHGRVYRVTAKDRDLLQPQPIDGEPIAELLERLKAPENRVRYRAKIELSERPTTEVMAAVTTWVDGLNAADPAFEHHLCEALWLHQHHNVPADTLLRRVLHAQDYHARAAATRVLCYWRDAVSDPLGLLSECANDAHPRVRLEAVRAASFFSESRAAEVALQAAKHPRDYYLNYTLGETLKQLEPHWKQAIDAGTPFAADNPAGLAVILEQLSPAELMKLPRSEPVYFAFLSRPNIHHDLRHEAVTELAKLHAADVLTELLNALDRADKAEGAEGLQVLADLAHMLTAAAAQGSVPATPGPHDHAHSHLTRADVLTHRDRIEHIAQDARQPFARQVAYVTLMTADGRLDPTWSTAAARLNTYRDLLEAVPLIPDAALRATAYDRLLPFLAGVTADLPDAINLPKTAGRFVRVEIPGRATLTLAEVQVFSDGVNIAAGGRASQKETAHGGDAQRAIDGRTSGNWGSGTLTHTPEGQNNPWWEVDLGSERPIERIVLWNRTDEDLGRRLHNFTLQLLDANRGLVWEAKGQPAPKTSTAFDLRGDPAGGLRRAAMQAIVTTGREPARTFATLAAMIRNGDERPTAVQAVTRIPTAQWPKAELEPLVESIIAEVTKLPDAERTTPAVRDALQLGDTIAALLPAAEATSTRKRLRELGVPVVVIRPVPHQMKYDRTEVYVEAGKPIELVFENTDLMPHNLLVAKPDSLQKVGLEAEKLTANPNASQQHYVPKVNEVLISTKLLAPRERESLTFSVPGQPGDYPFICTFPGHWRTMHGVLHVVPSLDDVPADVLAAAQSAAPATGPSRPFVRKWEVADLAPELSKLDRPRDMARGQKLFTELACAKCHKLHGQGGAVGPDFAETRKKLVEMKLTRDDLLAEMVTPSRKIDDKYRVVTLQKFDGTLVNGVIVKESPAELHLAANPLDDKAPQQPVVVPITEIEERFPSQVSLMPEGLLNTCTAEEVLDLLGYVLLSPPAHQH